MPARFSIGALVQTPFGKGLVREARNNGRFLVDVAGRAMVIPETDIAPIDGRKSRGAGAPRHSDRSATPSHGRDRWDGGVLRAAVDLHGLTVEEALVRAEYAVNEALLADCAELRLIHGRSGGRIRTALHRWLREISSVRGFALDPRNAGVTVVKL